MKKIIFALVTLFLSASPAKAITLIDILHGNADPLPIALPGLPSSDPGMAAKGEEIMGVVANDLGRTGLFRIIDKGAFIEKLTPGGSPKLANWKQINAQALVSGSIKRGGGGNMEIEFRLWDVFAGQQIAGKSYTTDTGNWRRIGHIIADEIYKRLTGEDGYFDTRIVYVAESGPMLSRVKRLAIMDQDGENHKYLTDGKNLVLTPRFSPGNEEVIYLSYTNKKPRVRIRNIETGREEILGDFPGMTFAPRFSAQGGEVVMSVAEEGNSEIYRMDVSSRSKTRLTRDESIDTSPYYSPDGSQIVFNSDRGGSQQLYIMNRDGSGVKRLSFGDGKYGTPVWSPRGDFIAFTKYKGGEFSIGVMRADGSGERILTSGYMVEGPTWSPNGRVLLYTKGGPSSGNRAGRSRLYTIDLTGNNEQEILTPTDASDPAWSRLLGE